MSEQHGAAQCVGISGSGSVACESQRPLHSGTEALAIQMGVKVNYIRTGNRCSEVIIRLYARRC